MNNLVEEALKSISNNHTEDHPFSEGQPLWVHGDDHTTWIAVGFFRASWSEWYAACVPEDNLTTQPENIPCSWLSDLLPNEKRYGNVIHVDFRRK